MSSPRAAISPQKAAIISKEIFGIEGQAVELDGEQERNFRIQSEAGDFVLKICRHNLEQDLLELWIAALSHLNQNLVPSVQANKEGHAWGKVFGDDGRQHLVWMVSWLDGIPLVECPDRAMEWMELLGKELAKTQKGLSGLSHPALERSFDWDLRVGERVCQKHFLEIPSARDRRVIHETLGGIGVVLDELRHNLRVGPIHGDANDHNWIINPGNQSNPIAGLIDIGDIGNGWILGEVAIACGYAMLSQKNPLEVAEKIVGGYHTIDPIPEAELPALWELARLRLCVSISMAAWQQKLDPSNSYLSVTAEPAMELLRKLLRISCTEVLARFRSACGYATDRNFCFDDSQPLQERRRKVLGPNLSLSYESPLQMVRGAGRYLFNQQGRGYLDAVNNVPHVGHSHPKVVAAAAEQMQILNTNTRYLHEDRLRFAERLAATFPAPLSVVYLVNSGSEANELALRLAKAHTGGTDFVVIDAAYHGNTGALVELSPYKFAGKGGAGKSPHVHVATLPDPYRGEFGYQDAEAGIHYADNVSACFETIMKENRKPAAFIAESISGCGGHVVFPEGYLKKAFEHAKAAGALAIADEVQVGLGRVGSHLWAFEMQGAQPDIVTMGKPIGNGHPLAAVITTPEIAASFDNGMEYFNTFGGNPVSCAIGNAVLDVMEEEGLQEKAFTTGNNLLEGLAELKDRFGVFGDVRGCGLYLGAVCVKNQRTKEADAETASVLVESMRHKGILLSTDGPLRDVIKIKPPLVFEESDAQHFLSQLHLALTEL
ncbi:MAG: aminotransferase class III-fold pyridoxal phosphate-dependent enzyme [Planctomycetota bacterium]|nr:aminotransferase class III-fold pyridoxal phosphate-dependent enzyme [Planctomycetota bacterium]